MSEKSRTMSADGPLVDTFGRVADDLRISVTDRCNFRCSYCMPAEGMTWLPKEELLTFADLKHPGLLDAIEEKKKLDDDLTARIKKALEEFGKQFVAA